MSKLSNQWEIRAAKRAMTGQKKLGSILSGRPRATRPVDQHYLKYDVMINFMTQRNNSLCVKLIAIIDPIIY